MEHNDLDRKIGASLRQTREALGWSLTDLAQRSGISRAMIHKVERGDSSPTAKLLGRLSGAFGLSISALLARAETPANPLHRLQDQPLWIDPETGYQRRQVAIPRDSMPLEVIEIILPPQAKVPMPAAAYAFQRQAIWQFSGTLTFTEGETRHTLQAGDYLHLGPPQPCRFENLTDQPCRYGVLLLGR